MNSHIQNIIDSIIATLLLSRAVVLFEKFKPYFEKTVKLLKRKQVIYYVQKPINMFQVSMNKFADFMAAMGYKKSIENNRLVFRHPMRLEFSCNADSDALQFYGENENCNTLLFNLGLVDQFKNYFKAA